MGDLLESMPTAALISEDYREPTVDYFLDRYKENPDQGLTFIACMMSWLTSHHFKESERSKNLPTKFLIQGIS